MALIICPECNKEISDQAKSCPHCGYTLPKTKKCLTPHQKKKRQKTIIGTILIIVILFAVYFFFSPWTMKWCCYHHINDATCNEPQKCSRCQKAWGEPLGHSWEVATCTKPKTCSVCNTTDGVPNEHSWKAATCTEPKICSLCGITDGLANGHTWISANCTSPKKCRHCGKTEGSKLGHSIKDYICTRCKTTIVGWNDIPNILDITSFRYSVNFVGGIDVYMTFHNKSSSKTINYITVDLGFRNSVGDLLSNEISRSKSVSLQYTGPLAPGRSSSSTLWSACFYNSTFSGTFDVNKIEIEYSDGTTLILDKKYASNAVKDWR